MQILVFLLRDQTTITTVLFLKHYLWEGQVWRCGYALQIYMKDAAWKNIEGRIESVSERALRGGEKKRKKVMHFSCFSLL